MAYMAMLLVKFLAHFSTQPDLQTNLKSTPQNANMEKQHLQPLAVNTGSTLTGGVHAIFGKRLTSSEP